jgi:ABC-type branched-subunit amino acid transport system substrate-binding protein
MRIGFKTGRLGVGIATAALMAAALPGAVAAQDGEPVAVCELAYLTGAYSELGPSLSNDVKVPAENVINLDPPLGRPWVTFHEDLVGTTEEAQAYRRCVDQHGAEVVVSIAHGYRTYRDQFLEGVAENDGPVSPSVHGGSIPFNLGGNPAEPIFRAQGADEQLGHGAVLQAASVGAEDVVIFAAEIEGSQIAANGAEGALPAKDIALLARLDVPPDQTSYRTSAQTIADLDPDAVILQAPPVDVAILINDAIEAGWAGHFIGETGMVQPEFLNTLGIDAIAKAESIGYAAFAPNTSTKAWEAYSAMWTEGNVNPEWENLYDQYHFSTYDILVQTALAAELAGGYEASKWAPAMREVVSAPGEVCYTYPDCLALIRAGQDIDYNGVTGDGDFTEGGFNHVNAAYIPFNDDGTVGEPEFFAAEDMLELVPTLASATCDDDNVCEW